MLQATGARVLDGEFEESESGIFAAPPRPKTLGLEMPAGWEFPPEIQAVIVDVAERFGVSPKELLSRDRHKSVAAARHTAQWVIRSRWPEKSYPELGSLFRRDHSTIMAAVRRIENEVAAGTKIGAIAIGFFHPTRLELVAGHGLLLLEEGTS